jgi:hypothetical protein
MPLKSVTPLLLDVWVLRFFSILAELCISIVIYYLIVQYVTHFKTHNA